MTFSWPTLVPLLALGIPLTFGLAAAVVPREAPLRLASWASYLAAGLAAIVVGGSALVPVPTAGSELARLVRIDVVTGVMLILVCTIALVIVRYSQTYLHGEPGLPRYARALSATLAAVTTLVVANHLAVIALAWMGTSLVLHQLLTFYPERSQALVAAHKKFLLSRLADVCVLVALVLSWIEVGSLQLDDVLGWVRATVASQGALPVSIHVAMVLLVVAISLRSAQLPFHGWLTQVMEAPTPVSALLHAGVVNIGGFLLLRLAPLVMEVPVAQVLLVVIGTTTTVVAALVMTTRVSVKVALAWSTCAQMGFMLIECGLGAWHLALLHLVAHSLYKAHAFLSSGSAVDGWRVQAIAPRPEPITVMRMVIAAVVAVVGVASLGALTLAVLGISLRHDPTLLPLAIILGLALAPFLARVAGSGWRPLAIVGLGCVGVTALYAGWHTLCARILDLPLESQTVGAAWVFVVAGFVGLFTLQVLLQSRPGGRLARVLGPRLFAGLYLDEIFTRMTFRIWPPRLSPQRAPMIPLHPAQTYPR